MLFYLWTCVYFLLAVSAQAGSVAKQEAAINDLGQEEALELFRAIRNSRRPTLTCLCLEEDKVEVCGVNGKRYANECAATCRRVAVACEGGCPCAPPGEVGLPPDSQLWHEVGDDSLDLQGSSSGKARKLLVDDSQ